MIVIIHRFRVTVTQFKLRTSSHESSRMAVANATARALAMPKRHRDSAAAWPVTDLPRLPLRPQWASASIGTGPGPGMTVSLRSEILNDLLSRTCHESLVSPRACAR